MCSPRRSPRAISPTTSESHQFCDSDSNTKSPPPSWCDPCRAEIKIIERHWRSSEQDAVLVLGINQQDVQEDARELLREFAITFPQIRDSGKETVRAWGVTGTPETFFISSSGEVVGHVIGVISDEQMAAGIVAARTGRPAGVKSGGDRRPTR